ncbi:MAG: S1 RNA-binding domain-containing protein [Thiolinea sp.]
MGEHCSMAERRADDATRDVESWLKCEYMQDHVGASYEGIISTVTSFGLFVELRDIYVEGLVHVTALTNDYYKV